MEPMQKYKITYVLPENFTLEVIQESELELTEFIQEYTIRISKLTYVMLEKRGAYYTIPVKNIQYIHIAKAGIFE